MRPSVGATPGSVGVEGESSPRPLAEALARLLVDAIVESLPGPETSPSDLPDPLQDDEEPHRKEPVHSLWTLVSPCSDFGHGETPQ